MAERIRAHDWAKTPLGSPRSWPNSLRAAVDLMLASPMAHVLVCGPKRVLIYNDPCSELFGSKHPGTLGAGAPEAFPELWPELGPLYDRVFEGEQVVFKAHPQNFDRGAASRDGFFDGYFSPARDDDGQVSFAFVTTIEVTQRVLADQALRAGEERQAFLLRLSDMLRPLNDSGEIIAAASEAIGRHLGVGQVAYAESDFSGEHVTIEREWNDGTMPSNARRHRLDDFGPAFIAELKQGRSTRIEDVTLDPALRHRTPWPRSHGPRSRRP